MTIEIETITIDGVVYKLTDLSTDQQQLVAIYKQWKATESTELSDLEDTKKQYVERLNALQLNLMKTQAALRQLGSEISVNIKNNPPQVVIVLDTKE